MPDRPKPAPESVPDSRHDLPESRSVPDSATAESAVANMQTDLATLAARFAAHGGGNFTPEFSAELALDIVLNEIVEQACLATGATGAVILLARDGEMVCRACSGNMVPELGVRLEEGSGMLQACVATRQIQKCDDAQTDPQADMEASRRLGIRSVIVLPLVRNGQMAGLLEAFSTRASAFGGRDQRTLETLAQRVVQNLERAEKPLAFPLEPQPPAFLTPVSAKVVDRTDDAFTKEDRLTKESSREASYIGRGLEVLTWALGLLVLGCALMLGVLVIERLGWLRTEHPSSAAMRSDNVHNEPQARSVAKHANAGVPAPATLPSAPNAELNRSKSGAEAAQPGPGIRSQASAELMPPGALRIYKNGREVFRVPSAQASAESDDTPGAAVQRASSTEPADTVEVSSAAAEDGLVHRVEPDYPDEARRQNIQGAVVLEVHIDRHGAVQEVKLISGPDPLAQAAIDAVKQWQFKPRVANGHLVEMQTRITLNFRLPQ
jgi:TonB family protein